MRRDEFLEMAHIVIGALVDDPDAVEIDSRNGSSSVLLEVRVKNGQAGQVIGKHGRNIAAVRTVMQAFGAKHGKKVMLEFVENEADRRLP